MMKELKVRIENTERRKRNRRKLLVGRKNQFPNGFHFFSFFWDIQTFFSCLFEQMVELGQECFYVFGLWRYVLRGNFFFVGWLCAFCSSWPFFRLFCWKFRCLIWFMTLYSHNSIWSVSKRLLLRVKIFLIFFWFLCSVFENPRF